MHRKTHRQIHKRQRRKPYKPFRHSKNPL